MVPVASRGRAGGFAAGPLLAICCLATILFLIAATIVLALIPIYLPTKSATAGTTQNYFLKGTPGTAVPTDGNLNPTTQSNIAKALDAKLNAPSGTSVFDSSKAVTSGGGRRRRRGLLSRSRRDQSGPNIQNFFHTCHFRSDLCQKCDRSSFILAFGSFSLSVFILELGQTIIINYIISSTAFTIPPITSATTTTTAATTPGFG
jgi:hypothetical protein